MTAGGASPTLRLDMNAPERTKSSAFQQPFIIGIAGGTASGKTTVCDRITQSLGDQRVVVISLDEFYRDLTPEERTQVNFDAPDAFDIKTAVHCLDTLKRCDPFEVPVYDFVTSKRSSDRTRHVDPADVIVMEGILVLHIPEILERLNMKIFVDTDDDLRLSRRIRRDTVVRGRSLTSVLTQYTRFVKPAFERFVLPSKQNADIIIPWRDDNLVAVDLVTQHIRTKLRQPDIRRIYCNLVVMESTMQIRGMHSKIRSRNTSRTDFVFYTDRLIRLVVETALGQLPFTEDVLTTPTGEEYHGVCFAPGLCGVSMIRSGEAMEKSLSACCCGIKIGKILIHRNGDNGQDLVYEKLPHDISERHVLLMDPILATGNSVLRAIEMLVKHRNVDSGKIILLTLMAAPEGIHKVCSAYPRLKVVTSAIEQGTGPDHSVRPGLGDFGDRYFGTDSFTEESIVALSPMASSSNLGSQSTDRLG
mmetsp:Transcript_50052/g.160131  ORF Transcript_50052/g.160131 Transcript_50052/m.160131 type:complete len:475 (-) Transcript_50052:102-1526(-)